MAQDFPVWPFIGACIACFFRSKLTNENEKVGSAMDIILSFSSFSVAVLQKFFLFLAIFLLICKFVKDFPLVQNIFRAKITRQLAHLCRERGNPQKKKKEKKKRNTSESFHPFRKLSHRFSCTTRISYRNFRFPLINGKRSRDPFLESPETFRAYFGWHNSLCIFKTKASRGTKLCSCFYFYSVYNIWKDQLCRISKS